MQSFATKKREYDIGNAFKKFELSGGSIINVVHYAGIKAEQRYHLNKKTIPALAGSQEEDPCEDKRFIIYLSDIREGIKEN